MNSLETKLCFDRRVVKHELRVGELTYLASNNENREKPNSQPPENVVKMRKLLPHRTAIYLRKL